MLMHLDAKDFDKVIKNNKKVVIDFYATWCGPCRALAPVFESVSNKVDGYVFAKIDVDNAESLAINLGVNTIPTIMIFENGDMVEKHVGYMSEQELLDMIGV